MTNFFIKNVDLSENVNIFLFKIYYFLSEMCIFSKNIDFYQKMSFISPKGAKNQNRPSHAHQKTVAHQTKRPHRSVCVQRVHDRKLRSSSSGLQNEDLSLGVETLLFLHTAVVNARDEALADGHENDLFRDEFFVSEGQGVF